MENLSLALWITVIGMSLVFGVIILLWGLILLIVRLGSILERRTRNPLAESNAATLAAEHQLAAALAVSFALARAAQLAPPDELHVFPIPPTAVVSPWQAVMRSKILNRRGSDR